MTEGHKTILKPEISQMSWVMLKKYSKGEISSHKYLIIRWKGFV